MNDISEIFNVDPNSWIESLSTYQKNIINQLYSQTNDYEVVANTWLTATIPMNVPFGTQKNRSIFFEKVLDEIEASLDDVNVERFASYLRESSEKTQFIVITHRRGTMEEADVLYGVTMQEEGISRVLELDVSDFEGVS